MNKPATYQGLISLVLLLVLQPLISFSQLQLVRYDSVIVTSGTDTLELAWAGGLNSPQFSQIDLDGDGLKDLFVFERNFYGTVKTFLNTGVEGKAAYTYVPFYRSGFPQMRNWALLADYNCDGHEDLFTDVPFGLAVYRNESTSPTGLRFTKVTGLLQTDTPDGIQPLFVGSPDIPAIADADNDGDLDLLTFNIAGNRVEYHKNLSIENYGDCDHLEFELQNRCWGYFSENDNSNGITLFDTCGSNVPDPENNPLHAGSTVLAIDLNGNGVKDLLLGDLSHNNIVKLENGGTVSGAIMHSYDSIFPANTLPVDIPVFPACYSVDVDNDGKDDLLVSPNNPVRSENTESVWYYKNTGEDQEKVYEYQTSRFLQNEMIDVGEGARPVFFDYDNDGLKDIVLGNYGYFVTDGNYSSQLALYRNTGTHEKPAYALVTDDFSGLSELGFSGFYPAFGDLDGDGVMEMVAGDEEGRLHLLVNTANADEPAYFALSVLNYFYIDVGQTAIPQLVDVDKDGLTDLLVGERGGTLNYFRNTGIATEAEFSAMATNDLFGGIDVMEACCTGYSAPFLTPDSAGLFQLYVGSEAGWLFMYDQIEQNLEGDFRLVDSLFLHGLNITVDGSDINADGNMELIYGELAGGIALLKTGTPAFLFNHENPAYPFKIRVYPNPATSHFKVEFIGEDQPEIMVVELISLLGETVKSISSCQKDNQGIIITVSNLPKGFYFVRIQTASQTLTTKILVQ